ncbi:SsrA-binding protein SmpB [Hippea maritima]|uniref:SsrA-binding protein n=1 Tax=Hippea maritima (strain ATCC 700847 / DSM 10411 / MH2) TaxID=760142 RepID=F2LWW2_HIPMA|nr:SsrA-binding protein SmpB [Hippea maritima]AEA34146.1 SsrA-binding protein [Hippea maritima DSM 10411]
MREIVNRKARHDYEILETYEAGLELKGSEVKSIRMGSANLKDSYAEIKNGEIWVNNFHISPYKFASAHTNHDPYRKKKLLLHKYQIRRLIGKVKEKGLTLIPLKVYSKNGKIKMELALAKGKKLFDKRKDIKERDLTREAERELARFK